MPTATTGATQAGCATTVMFLEDSVVLSIVQPVYGHQNRLYTQCVTKLISGSPVRRTFRFNLNNIGISDVPERSLTIKLGEEALHQMSCLADVKKNTGSAMANVGDKRKEPVPLDLKFSAWGLVSLLLLIEGEVGQAWFQEYDRDPSLLGVTYQAADYFGCKARVKELRVLLFSVIDQLTHASRSEAETLAAPTAGLIHCHQVLYELPEEVQKNLFTSLPGEEDIPLGKAMYFPHDVLKSWMSLQGDKVDLTTADLSQSQLDDVISSILRLDGSSITSLTFRLAQKQDNLVPNLTTNVLAHIREFTNASTARQSVQTVLGNFDKEVAELECSKTLGSLGRLTAHLKSLKTLHLLDVGRYCHTGLLHRALAPLSGYLTELSVRLPPDFLGPPSAQRSAFFNAIKQLQILRVLVMPSWHVYVNGDEAVLKALKSMPCLESILVGSIDADTSFASQLPLKQMSSSAPNPANPGAAGLMGFA